MAGKKTGLEGKYKNLYKSVGSYPAKNKNTISINPMLDDMQRGMGAPGMFLARRALLTKGAANMVKPKPTVGKKVLKPKEIKSKSGAAKFEKTMKKGLKIPGYLSGGQTKLDKNKDGKISGQDFAILRKEKAKGRGKGLQDEKLKPGKVMKAKTGKLAEKKISKVMKEYKEGKLHSGSKKGPKVKSKKQAIAIALSEARKKSGKA